MDASDFEEPNDHEDDEEIEVRMAVFSYKKFAEFIIF